MRAARVVLILAVALLIACPVLAQEKKKRDRGPRGAGGDVVAMMLAGLDLTAEQQEKVAAVRKECAPKLAEIQKQMEDIPTADQKKARDDAQKAAKEAGKPEREIRAAGREAMKLTDEQMSKMRETMKEMFPIQKEMRGKIMEILTPEQKEKVEKRMAEMRSKGEGRKKRDQ